MNQEPPRNVLRAASAADLDVPAGGGLGWVCAASSDFRYMAIQQIPAGNGGLRRGAGGIVRFARAAGFSRMML